jgi:hypothetical protein
MVMNFYVKNLAFAAVISCVVSIGIKPAAAEDIVGADIGVSDLDETVLVINGNIGADTGIVFKQALNENPKVKTILLNSGGGYVDVGLGMADLVANRGLSTWIPQDTYCASICSAIFFAGRNRMAQGQLGVHQVAMSFESNQQTQMALSDMVDAMNRYGVSQNVFTVMLRTPPDKMYFLNTEELVMWEVNRGVVIFEGVAQGQARPGAILKPLFPELMDPKELFRDDESIMRSLQLEP